jgi:hypothetical protein
LSVSESRRLALHKAARAALGDEEGDTLMELSPPANTDIATRQDIERTEERLGARIDTVAQRLDARIDTVAQRLGARIDTTAQRLDARIDTTAAELRSHTWKVVVGTGVALYLATVGTAFAGFGLLLRILDVV